MQTELVEIERLFRELYRKLKRESGVILAESGLANGDYLYMRILDQRRGAQASEIADEMGVQRGYVSALSRRLEALKLVQRSKIPTDARASLLKLTPLGERRFRSVEQRVRTVLSDRIKRLTRSDTAAFLEILRKMEAAEGKENSDG